MVTPPKPVEYFAVIANVLLAAVAIWGLSILAVRVLKGGSFRFAEMAVVLGLCIPLNALRAVLANQFPYLKSPLIVLLGVRGVMLLGACIAIAGLIGDRVLPSQAGRRGHRGAGGAQPVLRGHLRPGTLEGLAL